MIKSGSNEDLGVFVHVPVTFFTKIPKTQTKRRFPALVKHYIINLEFLNSPVSHRRARSINRNSIHDIMESSSPNPKMHWERQNIEIEMYHGPKYNKTVGACSLTLVTPG